MGYKSFNEREFLKAIKRLGEITTYFSSNPTAERFITEVIAPHCEYDCSDVFGYMNQKIMEKIPGKREEIFSLDGWKQFYIFIIKESNKCSKLAELLSYGVNFFNKIETYENYFRLATKVLDIDADELMNLYTIHKLHWIDVVDTMVKMANETLGETKKVEKSEDIETSSSATNEEPVVSEMEETGVKKPEFSQSEPTPDIDVPEQVNSEYIDESTSPDVSGEDSSTSMESEHSDVDVKETPIISKSSDRKGKRGYDIPIAQYKRGEKYPDIETASEKTGILIEEILKSLESRPTTKVDCIWKYTNKQKKEVIQFTYLHTYKNQSDIDKSSKEVCGKSINHSNVSPKLKKEWSSPDKGEFIYIQLSEDSKPEITSIHEHTSEGRVESVEIHTPDTFSEHIDTTYTFVDDERVRKVKLTPQLSESTEHYPLVLYSGDVEEPVKTPISETGLESAA